MRMHSARLSALTLSLAASLLLSACNTMHGLKSDAEDNADWINNKPSHLERSWGKAPHGYEGQHAARDAEINPPPHGLDAKWKREEKAKAMKAQESMTTTDTTVTTTTINDGVPPAMEGENYGQLNQQLFFSHGSAQIDQADKQRLVTFGQSVKNQGGTGITVVGHASTRVNTTNDPTLRHEINSEMAQKRANAVTGVLKKSGVEAGMVTSVSQGDEVPNANPGDRDQESADRRVEIFTNSR